MRQIRRASPASVAVVLAAVALASTAGPQTSSLPERVEKNVRAFMFTLEFALGAPFTEGQEAIIAGELRSGWAARTEAELRRFDAYPKLVEAIVKATDADALENVRRQLERTVREWLSGSDAGDPAVAAVQAKLDEKGRVLIAGTPPLTAMAADAYSEMYAFSRLLAQSPDARPDQIPSARVAEIRARLLEAWPGFDPEVRGQVASAPGLWVALRSVLSFGGAKDQARTRAEMLKIAAPGEDGQKAEGAAGGAVGPLVRHQVLMNIQNITFRQYLYCHGFKNTIY